MKSHKIWTDISSYNYKSNKSFGSEYSSSTYVGSSSSYSELFFEHNVNYLDFGNIREFRLWVDGDIIKRKYFNTKTKKFYESFYEVESEHKEFEEYLKNRKLGKL